MKAPERIVTDRLVLRKPAPSDANAIFEAYSSDPEATRLLSWPRHTSVDQTMGFIRFCDSEWTKWPAGPYVIELASGPLIGGTGFAFETPYRAATGYVLARQEWSKGYATEALRALTAIAGGLGIQRLYALCHPEHYASYHVLEKCGFAREGVLRRYAELPNVRVGQSADLLCYAMLL